MKIHHRRLYVMLVAVFLLHLSFYSSALGATEGDTKEAYGTSIGSMFKPMEVKAFGFIRFNSKNIVSDTLFLFVNTNCSNCSKLLKDLEGIRDEIIDRDVYVVVIDMDVSDFSKKYQEYAPYFFMLHDPTLEFGESVGVNATPTIVVLGGDGRIKFRKVGYKGEYLDEIIRAITD